MFKSSTTFWTTAVHPLRSCPISLQSLAVWHFFRSTYNIRQPQPLPSSCLFATFSLAYINNYLGVHSVPIPDTWPSLRCLCHNIASVVSMLAAAPVSVFLFCRLADDPRMILKQLQPAWLCPVGPGWWGHNSIVFLSNLEVTVSIKVDNFCAFLCILWSTCFLVVGMDLLHMHLCGSHLDGNINVNIIKMAATCISICSPH